VRGIILAGGSGTRLHPITLGVSKQLVPVYDKPMIYYPLTTLMLAGIRDVLVITTPHDRWASSPAARRRLPVRHLAISYATQDEPRGLAQAFVIGADFIGDGAGARARRQHLLRPGPGQPAGRFADPDGAAIFAYRVADPERYGVVEFDDRGRATVAGGEAGPAQARTTPCRGSTSTTTTSSTSPAS
jgi:glucose-1-phosphate thymidylyltransferase